MKALLHKNCIFNKAPVASSVTPTARMALRCQFSSLSCPHRPFHFSFDVVVSWQVFNEDPFSFVYNVCPSEAENPSVPCGQNVSCIFTVALNSNWFIYFSMWSHLHADPGSASSLVARTFILMTIQASVTAGFVLFFLCIPICLHC